MKSLIRAFFLGGLCSIAGLVITGCPPGGPPGDNGTSLSRQYPKISSWLARKDELIQSGKPFSLVMTGWFEPQEAAFFRQQNPEVLLLAGLSINWVWDNDDWMTFLLTVVNYGKSDPVVIEEEMYLHTPDGGRCAFGWASEEWGHEEIYAMDPRNAQWVELITSFYKNVLDQPQHDGIIVDMVLEKSWCPDAITDQAWVEATRAIMGIIAGYNTDQKLVVFNAGKELSDIDAYGDYMDGYVMENFLGSWGADYETGREAGEDPFIVVYAVDTDDTGTQDMPRMRLGLTLSLLNDNTCFAYDFGPRDHGQAWWYPEYDAALGVPLGTYYAAGNAYRRDFAGGTVISAPTDSVTVDFEEDHTDLTSGTAGRSFTVEGGDGRIFIRTAAMSREQT